MLIAHTFDLHVFSRQPETSFVRLEAVDVARTVVTNTRFVQI